MSTRTHLEFHASSDFNQDNTVILVGREARLRSKQVMDLACAEESAFTAMLDSAAPGDWGCCVSTFAGTRKVVAAVLPEPCSRHNSPSRSWAIPKLVAEGAGKGDIEVVLVLDEDSHAFAASIAVARAFPIYDQSTGDNAERKVGVRALAPGGTVSDTRIQPTMDAVRLSARLVDTPASELHTDALVEEARAIAQRTGSDFQVIRGEALAEEGFGGLWGVGKAAVRKPALAVIDHQPEGAEKTVVWVGKGIVYDTGGLSLKGKDSMPGMKGDMGGAASVLAAFEAAVRTGFPHRLVAIACIAENAIGPESTRPDDVLTLFSGKTVEVNNTDAEGRLVLADGVAWASKTYAPDLLADMATLTGAALVTSGRAHASIYTNDENLEQAAVAAGLRAGEPCHPLLYAPELLRKEFKSHVADMKNSVKDRANAQCSCAAQFIANHLPDPAPRWIHIDIAGTAWNAQDRGTGSGVGLLLELSTTLEN